MRIKLYFFKNDYITVIPTLEIATLWFDIEVRFLMWSCGICEK